jgi:hypothetical protein
MTNSTQPTNTEVNNMSTIETLFNEFLENGGEPKVTEFKRHLDQLIKSDIKHLCGRSAKSSAGDNLRDQIKARFGGRGAKWVFVSLDEIMPTLDEFKASNIDITDYEEFIKSEGKAWIRFAAPRLHNNKLCAAFEVRTTGSTFDHPKQLHYISIDELDDKVETMSGTPHSLRLEQIKVEEADVEEADVEVPQESEPDEEVVTVNDSADELDEDFSDEVNDDAF